MQDKKTRGRSNDIVVHIPLPSGIFLFLIEERKNMERGRNYRNTDRIVTNEEKERSSKLEKQKAKVGEIS